MGMFDSMYDKNGDEWQTKAFDCLLDRYQLGDSLPGPPTDYQVEIYGGPQPAASRGVGVDSLAIVRAGRLQAINVPPDDSLPLMDYHGGWLRSD